MLSRIVAAITWGSFSTGTQADKRAVVAMGATRWEMIRATVFPRVRSGMVASVMLGLGRAMGETIAAALVIGSVPQVTAHLFSSGDTMASVIVSQFGEAEGVHRSALIALG